MDSYTVIEINRNNIFENAFNEIMIKSPQELKKRPLIIYEGEEGVDVGGLLRYYFYIIINYIHISLIKLIIILINITFHYYITSINF